MANKVLVIGAHSDDYEYGCGGVIQKHKKRGDEVIGLVLTDGALDPNSERYEACEDARKLLGIDKVHHAQMHDGNLQVNKEALSWLYPHFEDSEIVRIYAPTPFDENPDHENCSKLVQRLLHLNIPELLLYEGPRNITSSPCFNPNLYIQITEEQLEKKEAAYKGYLDRQQGKLFFDVKAMAELRGTRGYVPPFAEAFEIYRISRKGDDI